MIRCLLLLLVADLACSLPISIYVARRGRKMRDFPNITPAYINGRDNFIPSYFYTPRVPRRLSLFELLIRRAKYIPQKSKKSARRSRNLKFRDTFNLNDIENFDPYKYKSNSVISDRSTTIYKSPLSFIKLKKMKPTKDKKFFKKYNLAKFVNPVSSTDQTDKNEIIIKPDILQRIDHPSNDQIKDFQLKIDDPITSDSAKIDVQEDKDQLNDLKTTKRIGISADERISVNIYEPSNSITLNLSKDIKKGNKPNPLEIPLTLDTSAGEQKNELRLHVYEPPISTESDKKEMKDNILIRPANVVFQRKGQIVQSRRSRFLKINFDPPVSQGS